MNVEIGNGPLSKTAPRPGCDCEVCQWATARIIREKRLQADLDRNYAKYLAGELQTPREVE